MPICLLGLFDLTAAFGQVTETNGVVRIEAESSADRISQVLGGVSYSWTEDTATTGFSGTGYLEAFPADGAATTTVNSAWESTSPRVNYTVTFSNTGTYYVWLRGYAGDASSAGVYVGLNGTSLSNPRIDIPQFNAWSWGNTAAGSSTPVALSIPSAGTYILNLWMRDAWLDIDRILLTRNPNFSPSPDANFWRNQNIYQIITDRFYNGEPTNDVAGLPNFNATNGGQAHGGDFKGIEKKLDYIKALGATAIWISPVVKNANGDYHGYAATDFYAVNPRMGTLADLQSLVREAQKRGILVINDVVVNHGSTWVDSGDTGWPAFRYPPAGYNLRYNSNGQQYAAPFDNASLQTRFGNTGLANIFHNNGETQNWGDATQVEYGELLSLDDFKTETTYIRDKMKEIWSYWIEAAGFDAYRLDTVKHVEMGFWDIWSPAIRAAAQAADKANFFQFGEVFDRNDDLKVGSYTGTKTSGIYKMESVIDYPLYDKMSSVFATASAATKAIEDRYGNLTTNNYDASALNSLVLNIDNHDNPRFLAATGSTTARLELALVFMYTSRGIPSLYYGTEQDFNGGADPNNREDMFDGAFEQGPSLGDNFNMTSARFKLVAKLNNLRRLYPALRTGTHVNLWANYGGPGLFAYARRLGNEEAYVVINTATSPQMIDPRPTIHPANTVLVDVMNPVNTLTVTAGLDGIPSFSMPATSFRIYVAQSQLRSLSPVVNTVTPAHDATGVNPASTITVTFSQAMNPATTSAAFSTTPASTGTYAWSAGNTVMTYTPSSNLAGNTLHNIRIESSATDSNGVAMYAPFESRFTTGAASTTARPSVNSFSASGASDTTATLAAAVTPNGAATTVSFEYGTTTNYGSKTVAQSIGSGNSPINVSNNLTGLTAGTLYHYRVSATNSVGATLGNDGTFETSAPLPQITTTAASFVTAGSASINGDVNPNSLETSVYFEWSDRSDVITNNITPLQSVGNGTTRTNQWAELRNLSSDTTYFFRMVGVNVNNSITNKVYGATLSFKTLPVKPTVTTLATTNVSVTNALLPGTVNPNGSPTVYFFEYGTNSSYGTSTTSASAGNGTNAVPVSATISNLAAGQTYFYRAAASNSFGVTYGAEQRFSAGLPPPSATTLTPSSLTTSAATLRGSVNPNNSLASAWFEWGTTTNYGSSSRIIATDTMEGILAFDLAGGSVAGGTGFGSYSRYSIGTGAGTFLASNSSNQTIDGAKSIGAYAGTAAGVSFRRSISTTRQYGTALVSARFNVDNTKGFSGFNLKSANGSGASGFGSGELVSFGIAPAGGNRGILVTDASGQRVLDLGVDVRNTIIDFQVDFDARARRYVVGAKFRTNQSFTKISGAMSGTGTNVTHVGFANWNSTGAFQDLMVDSLQVLGSTPLGGGTTNIAVSNAISSLSANTLYHYRVASMNLDGGVSYGTNATFYTGIDLAVTATNTNSSLVQSGAGQFTVTVSNAGASASSSTAAVTVSNQFPAGLTMTSMSGTGWAFNSNALTATRTGSLSAGTNYPPITIGFAVASNAASVLTNTFTVTGGGDGNSLNNTNVLISSVVAGPDLAISKATNSTYQQGGSGKFLVTVSNVGGTLTAGTVTVTEQPPVGMSITSMSGTGWTFNPTNTSVSRSDALAASNGYPPISVEVLIASNTTASLTNMVSVSGGGDGNYANNQAQAVGWIPLLAWRFEKFGTTANSGPSADDYSAAGDGIPNLLKYALGITNVTNPATNGLPVLEMSTITNANATNRYLTLTFNRQRDATDVIYEVQATGDLFGFSNSPTVLWSSASNAYGGGTNASQAVTVQDSVDASATNRRFMRLQISRPPP